MFPEAYEPETIESRADAQKVLDLMPGVLTPRMQTVIHARFFLGLTLKETGELIGRSSELARRIERDALYRLRWALA